MCYRHGEIHGYGRTWTWWAAWLGSANWSPTAPSLQSRLGPTSGNCSQTYVQLHLSLNAGQVAGRIVGSFLESLLIANAYRGELLALIVIHWILLSINNLHRNLAGSVEIVSDCLGALKRVTYFPLYRIPSQCRHSDILKNILVHCKDLSFTTYYSHIKAHQDNNVSFDMLSRKAQLNCICDHAAKQSMMIDGIEGDTSGRMLPLKPIGPLSSGEKWHPKQGGQVWFWAWHQLARMFYHNRKILSHNQFDSVDWISVHLTLHDLPRLFEV